MTRSFSTQAEVNKMDNVATGYMLLTDGSLSPIPQNWYLKYYFDDYALAAGAIRSTALDMAQWMRLNLALGKFGMEQIVSETNMRYLQSPRVLIAPWANGPASPYWGPVSYGAGWQYFGLAPQPLITHDGTKTSFKSSVMLVPGANIGIVILTNIGTNITGNATIGARSGVAQKIAFRFYDLYFGRETSAAQLEQHMQVCRRFRPVRPVRPPLNFQVPRPPPEELLRGLQPSVLRQLHSQQVVSGNLVMTMGPQKVRARMAPAGGNTFWAYMPDIPAKYPMYIPFTFAFPSSGPATMTMGIVMGWPQNDVFTRIK